MELSVYKIDGTVAKTVTLNEEIFGIQPNDHAIYLDVKQYLANQRQGTAKSKDRSEVAYSTKKLIRQKGSGGARHGSLKAGIYVGVAAYSVLSHVATARSSTRSSSSSQDSQLFLTRLRRMQS